MYPLYLYKFITDKILSVNVDEDMASRDWIWPLEIGSVESDNTVLHYEWEDQSVEVYYIFPYSTNLATWLYCICS